MRVASPGVTLVHGITEQRLDLEGDWRLRFNDAGWTALDVSLHGSVWVTDMLPQRVAFQTEAGRIYTCDLSTKATHWHDKDSKVFEARYMNVQCAALETHMVKVYRFLTNKDGCYAFAQLRDVQDSCRVC